MKQTSKQTCAHAAQQKGGLEAFRPGLQVRQKKRSCGTGQSKPVAQKEQMPCAVSTAGFEMRGSRMKKRESPSLIMSA